jgi:hypothetical protein
LSFLLDSGSLLERGWGIKWKKCNPKKEKAVTSPTETMYPDRLDGKIDDPFFDCKANGWRIERG